MNLTVTNDGTLSFSTDNEKYQFHNTHSGTFVMLPNFVFVTEEYVNHSQFNIVLKLFEKFYMVEFLKPITNLKIRNFSFKTKTLKQVESEVRYANAPSLTIRIKRT